MYGQPNGNPMLTQDLAALPAGPVTFWYEVSPSDWKLHFLARDGAVPKIWPEQPTQINCLRYDGQPQQINYGHTVIVQALPDLQLLH